MATARPPGATATSRPDADAHLAKAIARLPDGIHAAVVWRLEGEARPGDILHLVGVAGRPRKEVVAAMDLLRAALHGVTIRREPGAE